MVRSRKREDFRAGLGGEMSSIVSTGIIDDPDGEAGAATSADNLADGVRFVAGGDENEGG